MVTTTTLGLTLLIGFTTLINAAPDPRAEAGILKISQIIVHRIGETTPECETDDDCEKAHQMCDHGHCKCKAGFSYEDHMCVGGVGGSCVNDDDCDPEHSHCVAGTCECEFGYVWAAGKCLLPAGYGDECEADAQCPEGPYACIDGHCGCNDYSVFVIGFGCLEKRGLGEDCINDKQCDGKIPNSECNSDECECKTDFQLNKAEDACVPMYITVTMEYDTDDAWDADYADTASAAYAAYVLQWKTVLNSMSIPDEDINLDMVFTQDGANTHVEVEVTVENPDKAEDRRRAVGPSRKRRDTEGLAEAEEKGVETLNSEIEEQMKKDAYQETLTGLLMKREVDELKEPLTISIPSMPDNNLALDGFCLQNIDCTGNFAMCFENRCS